MTYRGNDGKRTFYYTDEDVGGYMLFRFILFAVLWKISTVPPISAWLLYASMPDGDKADGFLSAWRDHPFLAFFTVVNVAAALLALLLMGVCKLLPLDALLQLHTYALNTMHGIGFLMGLCAVSGFSDKRFGM